MKRLLSCGALVVCIVAMGCGDNRDLTAPRKNWHWDMPLSTSGAPAVECSPSEVSFGGTINCGLENITPLNQPSWSFNGALTVFGPSEQGSWSGQMVSGGTVTVDYTDDNGDPQQVSTSVTVTPRGLSWYNHVGGYTPAAPGEVDGCYNNNDPNIGGFTGSVNCTSSTTHELFTPISAQLASGNGYVAASVTDDGPNGGFWYVDQPTASMSLRGQMNRYYRAQGDAWPITGDQDVVNGCGNLFGNYNPQNVYTVNTACIHNADFSGFSNCAWTHESGHVNAGLGSARTRANDVYALWDPLIGGSSSDLSDAAQAQYSGANGRVYQDLLNGDLGMTPHNYGLYRYRNNSWYLDPTSWDC